VEMRAQGAGLVPLRILRVAPPQQFLHRRHDPHRQTAATLGDTKFKGLESVAAHAPYYLSEKQ